MPLKLRTRVLEYTSSSGTGDVVFTGARAGFRSFSSVLSDGDTFPYLILDPIGNVWEEGRGTFHAGANSMSRSSEDSSNGGSLVNLVGRSSTIVFLDASASILAPLLTLAADLASKLAATGGTATNLNAAITAGSIDNVAIGATTPSTGNFTSLMVSGAAVALASAVAAKLNASGGSATNLAAVITSGTIDNADIGQTTPKKGNFTELKLNGLPLATLPSGGVTGQLLVAEGWYAIGGLTLGVNLDEFSRSVPAITADHLIETPNMRGGLDPTSGTAYAGFFERAWFVSAGTGDYTLNLSTITAAEALSASYTLWGTGSAGTLTIQLPYIGNLLEGQHVKVATRRDWTDLVVTPYPGDAIINVPVNLMAGQELCFRVDWDQDNFTAKWTLISPAGAGAVVGGRVSLNITSTQIAMFGGTVNRAARPIALVNGKTIRLKATVLRSGTQQVGLALVRSDGVGIFAKWQSDNNFVLYRENAGSETVKLSSALSPPATNRMVNLELDITPDSTNGTMFTASILGVGGLGYVQDNTFNVTTGTWYLAVFYGAGSLSDVKDASYTTG